MKCDRSIGARRGVSSLSLIFQLCSTKGCLQNLLVDTDIFHITACREFVQGWADIKDLLIVEIGFDPLSEIGLILDNTSDDQTHSAQTSNLDGKMNTFIRVDPTKKNQVITAG